MQFLHQLLHCLSLSYFTTRLSVSAWGQGQGQRRHWRGTCRCLNPVPKSEKGALFLTLFWNKLRSSKRILRKIINLSFTSMNFILTDTSLDCVSMTAKTFFSQHDESNFSQALSFCLYDLKGISQEVDGSFNFQPLRQLSDKQ